MRLFTILFVLALFTTGCMSGRSPEPFTSLSEPDLSRGTLSKGEPSTFKEESKEKPLGPAWKRVVYRGRVLTQGSQEGVAGAVVSVFEGEDRLFTTITEPDGMFELPADLYGLEVDRGNPDNPGWRPESYYRIRVDAGKEGKADRPLAEIRLDERLVLHVG